MKRTITLLATCWLPLACVPAVSIDGEPPGKSTDDGSETAGEDGGEGSGDSGSGDSGSGDSGSGDSGSGDSGSGDSGSGDSGSGDSGSGDSGSGDSGSGDSGSGDDGSGDDGATPVDADGDGYDETVDCDDTNPDINPLAVDICDDIDNDCDGTVDNWLRDTFWLDADGDGYGESGSSTTACEQPEGYVRNNDDCDDTEFTSNPDTPEVCDSLDNNCDGDIDEGVSTAFYADTDADGYGSAAVSTMACAAPSGFVADDTDCDDTDGDIHPGATEWCDGVDNDCTFTTSEAGTVTFIDASGTPTDFTSQLTGAVTLSDAGTLQICEGTWPVQLRIEADVDLLGLRGSDYSVLDGDHAGTTVFVDEGHTVTIEDLGIINGAHDDTDRDDEMGGGLYAAPGSNVTIASSRFEDNESTHGGGIAVVEAAMAISDTEFIDNEGDWRGGDIYVLDCELSVDSSTSVDASAFWGGSIHVRSENQDARVRLTNASIHDSQMRYGALYVSEAGSSTSRLECYDSSITDNGSATGEAGGASLSGAEATLTSYDCDWGTSAGGDDNSRSDIHNADSDVEHNYGDGAWFTCTGEDCTDSVVWEGATGTVRYREAVGALAPDVFDCDISWDIQAAGLDDLCEDCVFGFEATLTYDSALSSGSGCMFPASDFSWSFAADEISDNHLHLASYGSTSWITFDDIEPTVSPDMLRMTFGVLNEDLLTYPSTYATYYLELDLSTY